MLKGNTVLSSMMIFKHWLELPFGFSITAEGSSGVSWYVLDVGSWLLVSGGVVEMASSGVSAEVPGGVVISTGTSRELVGETVDNI